MCILLRNRKRRNVKEEMFKYYNANPQNYHIPDCVIRAISTALGLDYFEVVEMLHLNGELFQCDDLSVRCYEKLLDYDFGLPHFVGNGNSAEKIARDFGNDIVILRMDGHLSVSIYGVIYDIFDCSEEIITDFWLVN